MKNHWPARSDEIPPPSFTVGCIMPMLAIIAVLLFTVYVRVDKIAKAVEQAAITKETGGR